MLSKKDLDSAELENVRVSKIPTTVVLANDEVQTKEETTVYFKELHLFVRAKLLEDTPAAVSYSENSAKIKDALNIGPVVRRHNSSKKADE